MKSLKNNEIDNLQIIGNIMKINSQKIASRTWGSYKKSTIPEKGQKIATKYRNNATKSHPCSLQNSQMGAAAEGRRPPLGGGQRPPVKDKDDRLFHYV